MAAHDAKISGNRPTEDIGNLRARVQEYGLTGPTFGQIETRLPNDPQRH
jgi:hypothetical protein